MPRYIYKPLKMNETEFIRWEKEQMEIEEKKGSIWIKNTFWRLEEISCVLVLRNTQWFQNNIVNLKNVWDIILKEREKGFEHRAPNKRAKKEPTALENDVCLLTIKK